MSDKSDKRLLVMRDAPPFKAIVKMTTPVVAGMMVNILYNLTDTYFIGLLGDPYQLAAAGVAMPVFVAMMALASLIGTGGASLLSRCLGAGRDDMAEKTLAVCVGLTLVFGLLAAVFGLAFIDRVPSLLGATEMSYTYTRQYVSILIGGGIFTISNFALGQLIRAEGSVMASMAGMLMGLVLSIALTPLFIFPFGWGVAGAAAATVIGNAVSAIFFFTCYLRKRTVIRFSFRQISFNKEILWAVFTIGIPTTLGQMLVSVSQMIANNIAGEHGDVALASLGVALRIMTIGTFTFMGFSAGCQPLMGYNYGEGNFKRLSRLIKTALLSSTILGAAIALVLGIFAQPIANLFSPIEEVRALSATVLRALIFSLPFMGGVTLCSTVFKAMGKPVHAFIIAVSRQGLIYIPLLFLFTRLWGFEGMVHSQPVTDFIMIIASAVFLIRTVKTFEIKSQGALHI